MSKLAAYLGPPIKIATIVEGGSHALVRQAADHPDGFGLGWFPADEQPEPLTLSSRLPLWREDQILRIARRYASPCVVAGLRKLGAEEPFDSAGCQPFQHGPWLFHHDGELTRFRDVFDRPLRNRLSDRSHKLLQTGTAPELLFATWLDALEDRRDAEAAANALEHLVHIVRDIALAADVQATLGILVTDGASLVTLRTATHGTPPPMYTIVCEENAPMPASGRVIASEPLFPGSWSSIDPHSLVIFTTEAAATSAPENEPISAS